MTSPSVPNAPSEPQHQNKAYADADADAALLRLQAFTRGCMARQRVGQMIAELIMALEQSLASLGEEGGEEEEEEETILMPEGLEGEDGEVVEIVKDVASTGDDLNVVGGGGVEEEEEEEEDLQEVVAAAADVLQTTQKETSPVAADPSPAPPAKVFVPPPDYSGNLESRIDTYLLSPTKNKNKEKLNTKQPTWKIKEDGDNGNEEEEEGVVVVRRGSVQEVASKFLESSMSRLSSTSTSPPKKPPPKLWQTKPGLIVPSALPLEDEPLKSTTIKGWKQQQLILPSALPLEDDDEDDDDHEDDDRKTGPPVFIQQQETTASATASATVGKSALPKDLPTEGVMSLAERMQKFTQQQQSSQSQPQPQQQQQQQQHQQAVAPTTKVSTAPKVLPIAERMQKFAAPPVTTSTTTSAHKVQEVPRKATTGPPTAAAAAAAATKATVMAKVKATPRTSLVIQERMQKFKGVESSNPTTTTTTTGSTPASTPGTASSSHEVIRPPPGKKSEPPPKTKSMMHGLSIMERMNQLKESKAQWKLAQLQNKKKDLPPPTTAEILSASLAVWQQRASSASSTGAVAGTPKTVPVNEPLPPPPVEPRLSTQEPPIGLSIAERMEQLKHAKHMEEESTTPTEKSESGSAKKPKTTPASMGVWQKRASETAASAAAAAAKPPVAPAFAATPPPPTKYRPTAAQFGSPAKKKTVVVPGKPNPVPPTPVAVSEEEEDDSDDDDDTSQLGHDYEEYSSAVKIQAMVRGKLARIMTANMEPPVAPLSFEERQKAFKAAAAGKQQLSKNEPHRYDTEMSFEERQKAFKAASGQPQDGFKNNDSRQLNNEVQQQTKVKLTARQQRLHDAAKRIQALIRGFLIRCLNWEEVRAAVELLEYYKSLEMKTTDKDGQRVADAAMSEETRQALAAKHLERFVAATKIQALARGFLIRKFDVKAMMQVMEFVRAYQSLKNQDADEDDYDEDEDEDGVLEVLEEDSIPEPKEEDLEKAFSALRNARKMKVRTTWIDPSTRVGSAAGGDMHTTSTEENEDAAAAAASPSSVVEDMSEPLDVPELLSTWDWLKAKEQARERAIIAMRGATEGALYAGDPLASLQGTGSGDGQIEGSVPDQALETTAGPGSLKGRGEALFASSSGRATTGKLDQSDQGSALLGLQSGSGPGSLQGRGEAVFAAQGLGHKSSVSPGTLGAATYTSGKIGQTYAPGDAVGASSEVSVTLLKRRINRLPRTGDLVALFGWLEENGLTGALPSAVSEAKSEYNEALQRGEKGVIVSGGKGAAVAAAGSSAFSTGLEDREASLSFRQEEAAAELKEAGNNSAETSVVAPVGIRTETAGTASAPKDQILSADEQFLQNSILAMSKKLSTIAARDGSDADRQEMRTRLKELVKTGKVNFDEVFELWNWLESNDFDMNQFKRRALEMGIVDAVTFGEDEARQKRMADFAGSKLGQVDLTGGQSIRSTFKSNINRIEHHVAERGFVPPQKDHLGRASVPEIEYLDEDLSDVYKPKARPRRLVKDSNGQIRYLDRDEEKSQGFEIEYLDDALSNGDELVQSAYKTKEGEELDAAKPSLKAMVNYWGFSKQHATPTNDESKEDLEEDLEDNGEQSVSPLMTDSRWQKDPSRNSIMSTLKWLDSYGVDLKNVEAAEVTPAEEDEGSSEGAPLDAVSLQKRQLQELLETIPPVEASPPEEQDLSKTMDWLMKQGFTKTRKTVAALAEPAINDAATSGEDSMEHVGTESIEAEAERLSKKTSAPKKDDLAQALKWWQTHGFGETKAGETGETSTSRIEGDAPESAQSDDHSLNQSESSLSLNGVEPDQAPVNRGARLYDSQVLSSLSWLQKHGFDLDKPAPSSSATNLQSAEGNAPSMHAMIDALDEIETKPEDTVEDEHRPLPENELHRKSKKKPKKKSSVQEMENALKWLSSHGIKQPKSKTKPMGDKLVKPHRRRSKSELDVLSEDALLQPQRRQSKTDLEVWSDMLADAELSEGSESSLDEEVAKRLKNKGPSAEEMSGALSWLNKRGIPIKPKPKHVEKTKREKKKKKHGSKSDMSASAAESLLEELKTNDSSESRPPVQDMEQALRFLKIRESKRTKSLQRKPPSAAGVAKALSFLGKHTKTTLTKPAEKMPIESINEAVESTVPAMRSSKRRSSKTKSPKVSSFSSLTTPKDSSFSSLGEQDDDAAGSPSSEAKARRTVGRVSIVKDKPVKNEDTLLDATSAPFSGEDDIASVPSNVKAHHTVARVSMVKNNSEEEEALTIPLTPKSSSGSLASEKRSPRQGARITIVKNEPVKSASKPPDMAKTLQYLQGKSIKKTMKPKDSPSSSLREEETGILKPEPSKKKKKTKKKKSNDSSLTSLNSSSASLVDDNYDDDNEAESLPSSSSLREEEIGMLKGEPSKKRSKKKKKKSKDSSFMSLDESSSASLDSSSASLFDDDEAVENPPETPKATPKATVDRKVASSSSKSPRQGARITIVKNEVVPDEQAKRTGGGDMANALKYLHMKAMKSPGTMKKNKASASGKAASANSFPLLDDDPDSPIKSPVKKPKTAVPTKSKSERPSDAVESPPTVPKKSKSTDRPKSTSALPTGGQDRDGTLRRSTKPPSRQMSKAEIDYSNALAWLEDNNVKDLEDAVYFKKLHNILPKSAAQSIEERAKEMAKALIWIKKQGILDTGGLKKSSDDTVEESVEEEPTPEPRTPKSSKADKAAKAVAARKNLPTVKDIQDRGKILTPVQKKKGKVSMNLNDDPTPESDFENALAFCKAMQSGGDFMSVDDSIHFKKLDNMLPKKANQAPEDRAKEMVKMLTWWRKKGKV